MAPVQWVRVTAEYLASNMEIRVSAAEEFETEIQDHSFSEP